ncbi:hypothetical protein UFOVP645_10 [uncultured Caudovirales phage]|uniref:Uncharacterized protein n=1 Tax=uncultured Caudovirales phage TaxID=2100421 RepID=A0A6J5N4U1_9CAUD|nr:hypothetical protein UFOVP645_10 [uncultured Caudovirales phage]
MKTIRYQKMTQMEPRDGVQYATTYVKQTLEQRKELCQHIRQVITEVSQAVEQNDDLNDFILVPLKGFKTTQGKNRSITDLLADMANEARGKQRNGMPKDFALAPIERWNKLFAGTAYAVVLVQTYGAKANNFNDLMELTYDIQA